MDLPLNELKPGLVLVGLDPRGLARVHLVAEPSAHCRAVTYEDSFGELHRILLYRDDLEHVHSVELEDGWPYDPPGPGTP